MTMKKTKTNIVVHENKLEDFFNFLENHIFKNSYPVNDTLKGSQCCLIFLLMIVGCAISFTIYYFLTFFLGLIYNSIFHTTTSTFISGSYAIFFLFFLPGVVLGIIYCCIYYCCIVPYNEWKKDLRKREHDLELGQNGED